MAAREAVAPPVYPSRSLFDLPPDFFDSCRLLSDPREIPVAQPHTFPPAPLPLPPDPPAVDGNGELKVAGEAGGGRAALGWTCHTCEMVFESLQDQRFHFKSDLHRLNVKLHVSGRDAIKEEDFDELGDESLFKEFDVSSISGSEDESDSSLTNIKTPGQEREIAKQKIYIRLLSGDTISLWRCLLLDDSEDLSFENNKSAPKENIECMPYVSECDLIKRLKYLAQEPRDKTHLRIVLLACGGHFAGCVFDGSSIIAHKTFHRYVVRAKAGKKQSAKDATGKAANSAGSYLRRYNEAALKKAEKDAKRKAKAKELKKLRKAKEKAKAQTALHQNAAITTESKGECPVTVVTRQTPNGGAPISKEEELKRALAVEREKRAAAAEQRIAALRSPATDIAAASVSTSDSRGGASASNSQSGGGAGGNLCSCCQASLAGKVPFHRYHYKYCSTSCMHVHREMLEDG